MGLFDTWSSIWWHLAQINKFEVYSGNTNESLHDDYVYKFALPFEKIEDPVAVTMFLQRNWYHSITLSVVYFMAIKLIQRFMRDREAFNLRIPLFLWNASLALFSLFGFIRFTEDAIYSTVYLGMYRSLCYTVHPKGVAAFWALLFAISKIVELGDTLFIVLRKKPLIFLHYYHHAAVLVGSAHAGAEHAAPARYFIAMNFFVHTIMYGYYASNAYGLKPSRKMAMLVTSLQIVQMLGGLFVLSLVYKIKSMPDMPCQQSYGNLCLATITYTTFAALFIQFYVRAYFLSPKERFRRKKVE